MASAGRTGRWRTLAIAAGVAAVIAAVYLAAPQLLKDLESTLYDQHFRLRGPRPPHPQVAIVAIDEASLAAIGRWPWSRTVLTDLVRLLVDAGAAAVAFDILLNERDRGAGRDTLEALARRLEGRGLDAAARRELGAALAHADPDERLAAAIRESGRTILAANFVLAPLPAGVPERRGPAMKSAIGNFRNYAQRGVFPPLHALGATFPIPELLAAAAAIGHVNMVPDTDGATRAEALVIESAGHYYPSLALESVRLAAGIDPFARRIEFGRAVWLGDVPIPTDARSRVLVDYAGPPATYPHLSAVEIFEGRIDPGAIKDKILFIGATAEGTYDLRVTPFSPVFPGVEKHANVAGNILDGRFIVRPVWVELLELASIVLVPLALGATLPAVRPVWSGLIALGLWAALFAAAHAAFRQGVWVPLVYPSVAIVVTFVAVTIYRILTEELQRLWTKRAFQQYVSPEVVERIMRDPAALQFGGEVRTLTVLFSDIRDFTTFTEKHDPQVVVQMLREYLTRMTRIVLEEGGTLDKYIGDAVMAEFGAPVPQPDHALRACRAALRMVAEVDRLREQWAAEGKEPFRIGIGVNTGAMVVGNLGSEQLFDYTVIGDEVNLGARLESLNKEHTTTTHIIVSEGTREAAGDAIDVRRLGEVVVKGKTRPVVVYELVGLRTPATV
jgi:adenylate cyclase